MKLESTGGMPALAVGYTTLMLSGPSTRGIAGNLLLLRTGFGAGGSTALAGVGDGAGAAGWRGEQAANANAHGKAVARAV